MNLYKRFPPSEPCSCNICIGYCQRPGWWTPKEAERAMTAGYAKRMMLEVSPDKLYGVLSPAFKGNEGNFALQFFSHNGCTFFNENLCELFNTGFQPLECRYCHHTRKGRGQSCHKSIGKEWKAKEAKKIIIRWGNLTGFWEKNGIKVVEK